MRYYLLVIVCIVTGQVGFAEQVSDIPYFKQYAANFASAGLPKNDQLTLLKPAGFDHVINLVPGDHSVEQETLDLLDLGYSHIPVDWQKPQLSDFLTFAETMQSLPNKNVLVHCELNWRASTFSYLYRVYVLKVAEPQAKADMLAIWQPRDQWLTFIDTVSTHFQQTPKSAG